MLKKIIGLIFTAVVIFAIMAAAALFLFSGCLSKLDKAFKNDYSSFSDYYAKEAALAYLKEKYGEEFIITYGSTVNDGVMLSGNLWYEARIVKKSEENTEAPKEYKVCVSAEGNYTVLGDTVICDYYNALYDEYVTPIIAKEMGDIPFVVIVESEGHLSSYYGVKPDAAIPQSIDDESNVLHKNRIVFHIYISESSDKGQMRKICKKIHDSLTEENYYWAYIVVLNDEDFNALYTAEDKYLEERTHYYNGKKLYKVE